MYPSDLHAYSDRGIPRLVLALLSPMTRKDNRCHVAVPDFAPRSRSSYAKATRITTIALEDYTSEEGRINIDDE